MVLDRVRGDGSLPAEGRAELDHLSAAFARLPESSSTQPLRVAERQRDKEFFKLRLARLVGETRGLGVAIDGVLRTLNGKAGDAESFAALHDLLEVQLFRVVYWRVASDEINYRRFFDINDLAALRMESDSVFDATHGFMLRLAAEGKVGGFRIDHPDGLYDPAAYFERIQARLADMRRETGAQNPNRFYVVIEKIDAPHEQMPIAWQIHGTTGYRFANLLNGVFVDAAARGRIDRVWRAFVEEAVGFFEAAYRGKRSITRGALAAELSMLATRLLAIARSDRHTRDLTLSTLWQALAEVAACFPVYRTYIAQRVSAQDKRYIDWAVSVARKRSRHADASVFDFIRDVLLLHAPQDLSGQVEAYRAFAMRFQQFTAPVTAKGVEDTAFYTFNRLLSLNEVGGDPDQFGTSIRAFHRANADR